jgi:hypothetical protein
MGTPSVGSVVLSPFPFSDLSNSKKRPSVVIASSGRGDWVLFQITSNPYSAPNSIPLDSENFVHGGLQYGVTQDPLSCLPQTSLSSVQSQDTPQRMRFKRFGIKSLHCFRPNQKG